jgi:PAS domain S-box-containing protein
VILTLPFVLLLVGTVAVTGLLSFQSEQRAVQELATQVMQEAGDRVTQHLHTYLAIPPLINRLNLTEVEDGNLDLQDLPHLEYHLFNRLMQFPSALSVIYAREDGVFRSATRLEGLRMTVANFAQKDTAYAYRTDQQGNRRHLINTLPGFDARRDRPWYRQAVQTGKPGWGKAFQFGHESVLAITAFQPVYAPGSKKLLGVFSSGFSLNQVSQFLHSLTARRSGEIYIVDSDGLLIASSADKTPFSVIYPVKGQRVFKRFKPQESQSPLIRSADQFLFQSGKAVQFQPDQNLNFVLAGQRQFVQVHPFRLENGLDWRIVVVLSEADFTAPVYANLRQTIVLCVVALGIAVVIGIAIASSIARPILRLSRAASALARGEVDWQVPENLPIAELDVVAHQLRLSLDQIQTALLQSEEKFSKVFRACPDAITIATGLDARLLDVNDAFCASSGYTRQELLGRTAFELGFQMPFDQLFQLRQLLHDRGSVHNLELGFPAKTGELRSTLTSLERLEIDGQACVISISKDITDRKTAEAILQQQEHLLEMFFTYSLDGFFFMMLDQPLQWDDSIDKEAALDYIFAHQHVTKINPALLEQYRATEEQFLGLTPADLFAHDLQTGRMLWRQFFDAGRLRIDTSERRLDGTSMWIEGDYICLYDAEGRITGHFGVQRDISDRKAAEAQLRQQQQFTEQIAESTLAILYVYDLVENRNVYVNQQIEIIFGYSPAEIQAMGVNLLPMLVHPEDLPRIRLHHQDYLTVEDGECIETEYRMQHKNGEWRWLLSRDLVLNRTPEGAPRQILGVATDITHLKQIQESLRDTQQQLQAILDNSPSVIYLMDTQNRYLLANQSCAALLSTTPEALVGKNNEEIWGTELAAVFAANNQQVLQQGKPLEVEESVPQADGLHTYLTIKFPLRDSNGVPYAVGGISTDITARKQAEIQQANLYQQVRLELAERQRIEAALRLSQERFAGILEIASDAIISIDPQQRITLFNHGAERIFGYNASEVLGEFLDVLLPDRAIAAHRQHVGNFAQDRKHSCGMGERSEVFGRRKDGSEFPAEASISKLDLAGEMIYTVILRDISDRKAAETRLRQQAEQEQVIRAITERIRQSLDLNTILNTAVLEIRQLLHSDRVLICRFEPDWSRTITHESGAEGWQPLLSQQVVNLNFFDIQVDAYREGQVLVVDDVNTARFSPAYLEFLQQFQVQAKVIVPILVEQNQLWGLLTVHHCAAPRAWQDWEIDLLHQLAVQVGIAVQQSQLYRQIQQQAVREHALNRELDRRVQERTAQLRLAISAARMGTWEWDMLTNAQYWSPENYTLLGFHTDEWGRVLAPDGTEISPFPTYDLFMSLVHPQDRKTMRQAEQQALQQRSLYEAEYRVVGQDGNIYWRYSRGTYFFDDQGQPIKLVGVTVDITHLKQTETLLWQLAEREQLLRLMTQRMRQSLDLNEILTVAVREVRQTLQADRALVFQLSPNGGGQVIKESVLPDYPSLEGTIWEEGCLNTAHSTYHYIEQTRIFPDDTQDEWHSCLMELLHQIGVQSKVSAPILQTLEDGSRRIWGILIVHACATLRQWQLSEADLLQQIANQLAIAIQQADLYQRMQVELTERRQAEERLQASLQEKDVLLKEIHHRVKNNMQMVSSLLNLQADSITDPEVLRPFIESQQRIKSMALVHEKLYRSDNLAHINFSEYVQQLAQDLFQSCRKQATITLQVDVEPVQLSVDTAIPCGLIINELLSNALKHAFPDQRSGTVTVQFRSAPDSPNPGRYILVVRDDGIGFPRDLDYCNTESLGLQLICALTQQLRGTIHLDNTNGTVFEISFIHPFQKNL